MMLRVHFDGLVLTASAATGKLLLGRRTPLHVPYSAPSTPPTEQEKPSFSALGALTLTTST
jgi:hypothetical protein